MDYIQKLTRDKVRYFDKSKMLLLVGIILAILVVILGVVSARDALLLTAASLLAGCLGGADPSADKLLGGVGGIFYIWFGLGLYCGSILGSFPLITVYITLYLSAKFSKKSDQAKAEYENLPKYYKKKCRKNYQKNRRKYNNYNNYSH